MRSIDLTKTEGFDEADALKTIVSIAPEGQGYQLPQMRLALRVLDKIEALDGGPLVLEDEEWRFAKERVAATKWMKASREIVTFVEKISQEATPPTP